MFNTCRVYGRTGAVLASYDKTHLFTPMGEHDFFTPGDRLCRFALDGVKCGVIICYDVRFPELARSLALGGMARQDEDGFYYLVDRKKDVIITGGENLYPVQIEDFLRRSDKIKDVAVIGLPDARLGEIAAAIVEVKDGETCTEAELNEFCRELPRYKRPRKIIFDKVPRNPTGKIEKPLLRERYRAERLVEAQTTR